MTLDIIRNNERMTLKLKGILDVAAALQLEEAVGNNLADLHLLVLDFTDLTSISPAGLRVLFQIYKVLKNQGSVMLLKGVNEEIREVFTVTGFCDVFDYFTE